MPSSDYNPTLSASSVTWAALLLMLSLLLLTCPHPAMAAQASKSEPQLIIIGGDRDYPPYEFIDKDGHPAGYNVELTHAIAEVMGLRVEIRLGGWAEMRSALKNGEIDALQGMSWSEERAGEVGFSVPHAVVNHAVFARKDSPAVDSLDDLAGRTVAVHRLGIMHDFFVRSRSGARLVPAR